MFMSTLIVCGLMVTEDTPKCMIMIDEYGPFLTEENCWIRTEQMQTEMLSPKSQPHLMYFLNYPDVVTTAQKCEWVPE